MDSSNQQTNPQPEQQPTVLQTSQQSQQTQTAPVVSTPPKIESNNSSNNILVWLIVGLIVLILAAGGIYIYLNRQEAQPAQTGAPQTQVQEDSLESELNTIDVESEGTDFAAVDQDLQSL